MENLINQIHCEDCLLTMARMPDEFIDLTVTSPPYDNLRDYKGYKFDFENIAKELFRVTKNGGVVVWIVGDATINGSETGTSFKQALYFKEIGFNLHDTMIYEKLSNSIPTNCRYSQLFEYMFIFSKENPKTINLMKCSKLDNRIKNDYSIRSKKGIKDNSYKNIVKDSNNKIRSNIWTYVVSFNNSTTDIIAYNHPAIFPEKLAGDHIISWSNEGDLIYDPFMGSGTTAKQCILKNRNYIGSEISEAYCKIAEKRIRPILEQQKLF